MFIARTTKKAVSFIRMVRGHTLLESSGPLFCMVSLFFMVSLSVRPLICRNCTASGGAPCLYGSLSVGALCLHGLLFLSAHCMPLWGPCLYIMQGPLTFITYKKLKFTKQFYSNTITNIFYGKNCFLFIFIINTIVLVLLLLLSLLYLKRVQGVIHVLHVYTVYIFT